PVNLIQIDVRDPKSFEARVACLFYVGGAEMVLGDFCGDEDISATRFLNRSTEDFFRVPSAVVLGGVDETHPELTRSDDGIDAVAVVDVGSPSVVPRLPCSGPDGGDACSAPSEVHLVHRGSRSMSFPSTGNGPDLRARGYFRWTFFPICAKSSTWS